MKRLVAVATLAFLTGCAGLQTGWVFQLQMQYVTPQDEPARAPLKPSKDA